LEEGSKVKKIILSVVFALVQMNAGMVGAAVTSANAEIPQGLAIKELLRSFGDNPLVTMLYIGTVLVSKIVSLFTPIENTHYWEVAKSSKEAHVSI
jgi:hypothetical protein